MVVISTLIMIVIIAGVLILSRIEDKEHKLQQCQISNRYWCECQEGCRGNPVGCKSSINRACVEEKPWEE